ncbi:helicase-exonuclease AddAB subunit AddB [Lachnospiraceae bacterium LCP25S3_G4]
MSLQFIFGNSGAGKSHYLYQRIIKESRQNSKKNYVVVVPEQFTMQTQKDFVTMHPNHGIMNIDVLSFVRLAHRIFEEVGYQEKIVLDDIGKNLILRSIADQYIEELKVLRGNLKKLGYISEVKSVISEFTQYDIKEEQLEQMMSAEGEGSYLYWKLKDLFIIYKGFRDYLQEKYITGEEVLDVLCDVAKESRILKNSVIVLDGFTGFTPVQHRLLREFMCICDQVMVTVTIDENQNPYQLQHKYQLFALSKETVTTLMKIAKEANIEIEEPVCLYEKPVYRFRENEALAFLESEIFRYSCKHYHKIQNSISIHEVKNPIEETTFVASEIHRLVREEQFRYREIAIIVSDMGTYAEHLERALKMYRIPVFMDYKRSILLNSFVEYIRSFLFMIIQNFSYESVFRFLRTGLFPLKSEQIDLLENYVIALGIRGYRKWDEPWIRRYQGIAEAELSKLNHVRVTFIQRIESVTKSLRKRRKTVKDITIALYDFLVKEDMQKQLKEYEEFFQQNGEQALAKEYAQVYRIVIDLFDKFVEVLGNKEISLKEYADLLDSGFEESKVGVIPPNIDQVVVGDIERTRLTDVKALFFVGMNDTWLPGNQSQNGLLSERDRGAFTREKLSIAPTGKEKIYIQKFYLYLNMTKPTHYLYLSYSKVNCEGKSLRPAYLIPEIQKLFDGLEIQQWEQKDFCDLELSNDLALSYIIKTLQERKGKIDSTAKEIYNWYREQEKTFYFMNRMIEASHYKKPGDAISANIAKQLYARVLDSSVTRLEKYSACAYAHFLAYGLALKERQIYEFQAMDWGNVFHQSIEKFATRMEEEGHAWTNIPAETVDSLVEECVEASIIDYGNTVLHSSARSEYMIRRIKRMLRRTIWGITRQLDKGDFIPRGYEVVFDQHMRGKIDRIDLCEDGNQLYVKVIDYKTGTKSFDLTAFYHGLQLQLVLYMHAALELERTNHPEKNVVPAGIFYYQMKDPIVDKVNDDKLLDDAILKELKLDGLVNSDLNVIHHLDKELKGNSLVVPIGKNKDGSLSKSSRVVTEKEFETLTRYAVKSLHDIEKKILQGNIEVAPYEMGNKTGCDYCNYQHICGFDTKIEGYTCRKISKMKTEEIMKKMEGEI